jgi:phosphoadenosine phosphosulfate reductase
MAIAPERLSGTDLFSVSERLEAEGPETTLAWTWQRFGPDISLACSMGGPSGMALVDMVARLGLPIEVFYLDTGLLFPEAYEVAEQIQQRYGIRVVGYKPELSVDEQAERYGDALWARDPDRCCEMRKIEPTKQALAGKRAWITGIRRDQTSNRNSAQVVQWDDRFGLVKVNPLVGWTEDQVWDYVREHEVPYNPLLDQDYISLGCQPCTKPVQIGEDRRAGRWVGFVKTECGLHLPSSAS